MWVDLCYISVLVLILVGIGDTDFFRCWSWYEVPVDFPLVVAALRHVVVNFAAV